MSKTDEHKIDNQWIPCAKRMPTEGVAWYLVTLQKHEKRWVEYLYYTWAGSSYKYAFQRQTGEPIDAKIIAWMLKPKPYQPPKKIPEEPDTKSVKIGEVYQIFSKDQTNLVRSINIVDLDDQLMGWIPIWVEKPKEFTVVNLFLEDDEIGWGYRNDDNIFYSSREHIRYNRKVIAWRETNPDEQSIPDLELFWEPSPPKHQLFDLRFVPFSSFKPWKTGEYLLYDKKTNTYKTIKINKSNLDCRIDNYDSYTHWALVREEK